MQRLLKRGANFWPWLFLGLSTGLWLASVLRTSFSDLSFVPPLARMGIPFWIGLLIILIVFFWGEIRHQSVALVTISLYYIASVSIIFDLPIMHDSLNNTAILAVLGKASGIYGESYAGFPIIINWVYLFGSADAMTIARFFPLAMSLAYPLVLGLIGALWQKKLLTSSCSIVYLIFFILVFGDSFYLRINASPQTIAFFLFLIALALIPLSTKSILLKIPFLVTLLAMIITHPITPLLALPGILAVGLFSGSVTKERTLLAIQTIVVFSVGYTIWTLYRAEWVLTNALKFIEDALQTEKIVPIVGYSYARNPALDNYLFWHRISLIAILILLALAYVAIIKTKTWRFISLWGIFLLPPFLIPFSYRDFFDRVILFSMIPCAVLFSEAIPMVQERIPKLKGLLYSLLISLALLSAYTSHFSIGAVDRITNDELLATNYLVSMNRSMTVYAGGFSIPLPEGYRYVSGHRGDIELDRVQMADAVIITPQMKNALYLNPRPSASLLDLYGVLEREFHEAYVSGQVEVYLRNP